jgi:mannose-6-phosphate isomerase-like protein (cupin superfamily)
MFVKNLRDCKEFIAGDDSVLRELLHPDKSDLEIRYSLAHAQVAPGQKTRPHTLRTSEVYYILTGQGLMTINGESAPVAPNCVVYIPPNAVQYIENTCDTTLEFLCIVDPAWRESDEKILDS